MTKSIASSFFLLLFTGTVSIRSESFDLVDGVVVSNSREAVYLMRPSGGIESVEVSSGTTRWTSEDTDKPLGVLNDTLVAQIEVQGVPNSLQIASLDAATGSVRQRTEAALPDGIWGGIDDVLGRSFSPHLISGTVGPLVSWEYAERYSKGIAPGPDESLVQTNAGAYRLEAQGARLIPARESMLEEARTAAVQLPEVLAEWAASRPFAEAPTSTGLVFAATEVTGGTGSESGRITLKRWDRSSAAPLPDVELHRGPHILQLRSVDRRHVLITERLAPGDVEEYEWSVFSLEDGKPIGHLRHRRSHATFFVRNSTIVFVEPPYASRQADAIVEHPRRIRASVLGSGSIVWERELRDTAYRGPSPP